MSRRPLLLDKAELAARDQIHDLGGGWGGRIRTFNLLIQSDTRYR